ncbi:xanthine dehydrogenase family protein subunit M [soil metagenome]
MNPFQWTEPATLADAFGHGAGTAAEAALVRNGKTTNPALFKAGGVDLLDLMKENIVAPARLVGLRLLPGLNEIRDDGKGGLRIGAMVTLAQIETHPALRKSYTAFADAAGHSATPQVRNAATIGGNLLQRPRCWYFRDEHFVCLKKGGDTCFAREGEHQYHAIFDNGGCMIVHPSTSATALVAFGARLEITGPKGAREVALEEFLLSSSKDPTRENSLQPNELITEIRLPAIAAGTRSAHIKQGEKESFDWPIADVAVVLEQKDGRCTRASVVMGAAAPVPLRSKEAEAALIGQPVNDGTARAAAKAAIAGATPLEKNRYKVPVLEAVIRRTILQAAAAA